MQYVDELMGLETNFDIIHRVIRLGDTDACMYLDRKSTRLNSSHNNQARMPSSA